MMEQHPIPQDITGFKFKLVGDMTLGQFGYLAGGLIMGWIFWSTPWYPFFKIPLAVFTASAGAAFAFLPVEDRPLAIWVKNFFKSIYQPTFLVWEKTASTPLDSPLLSTPFGSNVFPQLQPIFSFPKKQESVPAPVANPTVTTNTATPTQPTVSDQPTVTPVAQVASQPPVVSTVQNNPEPVIAAPTETMTANPSLSSFSVGQTVPPQPSVQSTQQVQPPVAQTETTTPAKTLSIDELIKIRQEKIAQASAQTQVAPVEPPQQEPGKIIDISQLEQLRQQTTSGSPQEIQLQELKAKYNDLGTKIEQMKTQALSLTLGEERTILESQIADMSHAREVLTIRIAELENLIANPPKNPPANYNKNVNVVPKIIRQQATVSLSDIPNVISGLVKDAANVPVVGAIVLINDQSGNPVRALKTNKIGQFITNTPLDNGSYYLEVEKEGLTFDTLSVQLSGAVLPLLEISGKAVSGSPNGSV